MVETSIRRRGLMVVKTGFYQLQSLEIRGG